MGHIDRLATTIALGACVVGAGTALAFTGSAATPAAQHALRSNATSAKTLGQRTALHSVIGSAERLTAAIRHVQYEANMVLAPSFASLARAQASLSVQRAQIAQAQQQINGEVAQLTARASALAAEGAALQREAAALRSGASPTHSGPPPSGGSNGDN